MTAWLSEETWNRLDSAAGRLDSRGRRVLGVGLAAGALVAVLAALVGTSGVLVPRLTLGPLSSHVHARTHSYVVTASLHNDGWFTEQVTSVSAAVPDVRVRIESARPAHVLPGHTGRLAIRVTIADCRAAEENDLSLPRWTLRVDRPWGTASLEFPRPQGGYDTDLIDADLIQQACGHSG